MSFRIVDFKELEEKKISVVLATFRKNPKFELLFKCLSRQTIKNFELVIADYLYETRKDYIRDLAKKYGINVVHVGRDNLDSAHSYNIGIVNSSGDYILYLNDCTYHHNKWIEKHMFICVNNFISLGTRYFTNSLDFFIDDYSTGQVSIDNVPDTKICEKMDKQSGINDYLYLNFGEHKVLSPWDIRLLGIPRDLVTQDNILTNALPGWSYGGSVGAPTEMYLNVNGFDERYDGGYGWNDCDLGVRFSNKGYKSFLNISNWFLEIQDEHHEHILDSQPELKGKEKVDYNWKLYEENSSQSKTWVNPKINLREMRKKILESRI